MSASDDAPWAGKTALVVDDYAAIRKNIKETLLGLGLSVLEADHGLAALETLKKQPVDMIVSDLVMPEMDGFELTETLKGSPQYRRIPLVIVSTHDDAKYIFRALHHGADDYLVKPPTPDMVKAVLARMFDYAW